MFVGLLLFLPSSVNGKVRLSVSFMCHCHMYLVSSFEETSTVLCSKSTFGQVVLSSSSRRIAVESSIQKKFENFYFFVDKYYGP
jgi:hypothetical protein